MTKLAPSILSADFCTLGDDIAQIETGGADYIHIDVMDGIFVPNISIGIPVVKSVRRYTQMFLDVHLMIDRPHRYVGAFCDAGADLVVFHVEADEPQDVFAAIEDVKAHGKKVGLAIKPKTPESVLIPYLPLLDLALVDSASWPISCRRSQRCTSASCRSIPAASWKWTAVSTRRLLRL